MGVRLVKTFNFEAAHRHPGEGKSENRIHGHRFHVHVSVQGEPDPDRGWLVDFGLIKQVVKPAIDELDHRFLNDLPGLESGLPGELENWIKNRITRDDLPGCGVRVECRETLGFFGQRCEPDPYLELPERFSFRFEAAHSLPKTPVGHKCRRLHGHSYEIGVAAPDLEFVAPSLERLFAGVDHQCLNELPGLSNPTAENLSIWAWSRLVEESQNPTCLIVGETCESICVYRGA